MKENKEQQERFKEINFLILLKKENQEIIRAFLKEFGEKFNIISQLQEENQKLKDSLIHCEKCFSDMNIALETQKKIHFNEMNRYERVIQKIFQDLKDKLEFQKSIIESLRSLR